MNNDVLLNISKWMPYFWDKLSLLSVNKNMIYYYYQYQNNVLDECIDISLQYYDLYKYGYFVYYYIYADNIKFVLNNHLNLIPSTNIIKHYKSIDDYHATGKSYTIGNFLGNTKLTKKSRLLLYHTQKLLSSNYGWMLKTTETNNFITYNNLHLLDTLYVNPINI